MYHSIKKLHKLKNVVILLLIETCATVEIGNISKSHTCFVISINNRIVRILQRKIFERISLSLKYNLERILHQDGALFLVLCSASGHSLAESNNWMLPVQCLYWPWLGIQISAQKCLAKTSLLSKSVIIKF